MFYRYDVSPTRMTCFMSFAVSVFALPVSENSWPVYGSRSTGLEPYLIDSWNSTDWLILSRRFVPNKNGSSSFLSVINQARLLAVLFEKLILVQSLKRSTASICPEASFYLLE